MYKQKFTGEHDMTTIVYDKVKWHYPDGKGCESMEAAKYHLIFIMSWLSRKGYLTEYGKEIYRDDIDSEFSLTSDMVSEPARTLLSQCYKDWVSGIQYNKSVTDDYWNEAEAKLLG